MGVEASSLSTFGMKFSFTLVVVAAFALEDYLDQDENVDDSMLNDYDEADSEILSDDGESRSGGPGKGFAGYTADILDCLNDKVFYQENFKYCNSRPYMYNCLFMSFYKFNEKFCNDIERLQPLIKHW